ncbi:unnamed protein product, partial [Didymodactylos carnosus]
LTHSDVEITTQPTDLPYRQSKFREYEISQPTRTVPYGSDSSIYRKNIEVEKPRSFDTSINHIYKVSHLENQSPTFRGSHQPGTNSVKYYDSGPRISSEYNVPIPTYDNSVAFKGSARSSPIIISDTEVIPSPLNTPTLSGGRRRVVENGYSQLQQIDRDVRINDPTLGRGYGGIGALVMKKPVDWKSTSVDQPIKRTDLDMRSTSSSVDADVPKLVPPTLALGRQKKEKRDKSNSTRDKTSSMTTIQSIVNKNIHPSIYGSLPDAEILSSIENNRPARYTVPQYIPDTRPQTTDHYGGLEAIVQHHFSRASLKQEPKPREIVVDRYEVMTTTAANYGSSPTLVKKTHSPQRYTTSTEMLDGSYYQHRIQTPPLSVSPDISITRKKIKDLDNRTLSDKFYYTDPYIQKPKQETDRYSPEMYRTTKIIDIKDKHIPRIDDEYDYVKHKYEYEKTDPYSYNYRRPDETKTWKLLNTDNSDKRLNLYETDVTDDINIYREPYVNMNFQKINDRVDTMERVPDIVYQDDHYRSIDQRYKGVNEIENRYSPRQKEVQAEDDKTYTERYEVTYEIDNGVIHYGKPNQKESNVHDYRLKTGSYNKINDKHYKRPALTDLHPLQTLDYNSSVNEDKYRLDGKISSVDNVEKNLSPVQLNKPRHYTLKRTKSYDGLGIYISADSQTCLNHFIKEVEPKSPGERAGLKKNDRIISVNGVAVENVDFTDVLLLIKQGLRDDNLKLTVVHTNTNLLS